MSLQDGIGGEGAAGAAARAVARAGLAFVFAWHGLVPKLLVRHPDEALMLTDGGIASDVAWTLVTVAGVAELALAASMLVFWTRRWPSIAALVFLVPTIAAVAVVSPRYVGAAFNPVSLNLAASCLAVVDLLLLGSPRRSA